MAFILTPRFAPAYQTPQCNPFGCSAPVTRPAYTYRVSRPQPRRPSYFPFEQFVTQLDDLLLGEIDREAQHQAKLNAQLEAQREAHRQRQLRKQALRAKFAVSHIDQGWQVAGDIQGFEQENISIELVNEHTLKISGNTQWHAEESAADAQVHTGTEHPSKDLREDSTSDTLPASDAASVTVSEAESATLQSTSSDSDTESHKSYQATVEDDFEDLGPDAASLIPHSMDTSSPAQLPEPKGKEKATEEPRATETTDARSSNDSSQHKQQVVSQDQDRVHGTFEKIFSFPERIDVANVGASFKDGALRVTVPKAQSIPARRIAIQ